MFGKFELLKRNNLLFFLMGFFVFSSISSILLIDYLHFPISMPEVMLLPFIYLLKDKFRSIQFRSKEISNSIIIVAISIGIGLVYGKMSFWSMLSSGRSWLYIFILCFTFRRENSIENKDLMYLSFGSILGWLIASLHNVNNIRMVSGGEDSFATYGAMLAIPIFLCCSIKRGKYLLFTLGMAILLSTMVFASIRRLIVVAILSLIISLFFIIKSEKSKMPMYLTIGAIIIGSFFTILPAIKSYIEEVSPAMYYRTFVRMENLLEDGSTGTDSDDIREGNITYFWDNIIDYTIPHGMVGKVDESIHERVFAPFMDFPLLQPFYIFGLPIALYLLLRILGVMLHNYRKFNIYHDETTMVCTCSLIVMFALLFIEGTFLYFPYAAPFTGVLLGKSMLNAKQSI